MFSFLACGFVTMVSWYQKTLSLVGSQISFHEVSSSILMHHNFGGWFLVGHIIFGLVFSITSSNSFSSHYERSYPNLCWFFVALIIPFYLHALLQHFFARHVPFFSSYFLLTLLACCKLWLVILFNLLILKKKTTINL